MKSNLRMSPLRKGMVALLLLLLLILGGGAFFRMDMRLMPDQPLPTYTIRAQAPGMEAELMVERVTKPLEEAIRELGQIDKITSRTENGSAQITLKVKESYGSDYEERLREKLEEAAKRLPGGADSVQLEKGNTGDRELAYYLLHGSDLQMLSDLGKYTVTEKLANLPGVSRIVVEDEGIANKVEVLLRPSMLQTYGLTPQEVLGHLQAGANQEQVGSVGEEADGTGLVWIQQAESVQELGRTLIPTSRGYVALSLLADIRDLRGSEGESAIVYKGNPALGIRIYGQESSQWTDAHDQLAQAIAALNEEGKGRYALSLVEDHSARLMNAVRDCTVFLLLAALLCAGYIGYRLRSVLAGLLCLSAAFSAFLTLLSGAWLLGLSINMASLGPIVVCVLFYVGAGTIIGSSIVQAESRDQAAIDQLVRRHLPALVLALLIMGLLFLALLFTDFVKPSDKPSLYDGLPIFGLGLLGLLAGYGVIFPALAPAFLRWSRPQAVHEQPQSLGKLTSRLSRSFQKWMGQKYIPYTLTVILSLATVEILHTFVLTDPFLHTQNNQMKLTLNMVKGSHVRDAIAAAKKAEEKLLQIGEVADLYTVASEERLDFHVTLKDKYEWSLTKAKLEEALEKTLHDIPGTNPFDLVVGEEEETRLEFRVKGISFHTTHEIASQVQQYLIGIRGRDEDGNEIITDERIGEDDGRVYIHIRPKKEMMARYQISENQVKEQLSSYLGEQSGGSLFWNNTAIPLVVRYPEMLLEHADQAKQLLIRTAKGTVRLQDLVDWQIGTAPTVVEREDGYYVVQVSSAIADPGRIDSLYYTLPDRMKEKVTIPEGYAIQTGEDLRKLEEEESEKKDMFSRVLAGALAAVAVLAASLALRRRMADGLLVLLLLPTLMGAVLLGLLVFDRPLNILGVYGAIAACALLSQLALAYLTHIQQQRENSDSVEGSVMAAAKTFTPVMGVVLGAVVLAALPLAFGWGTGIDFHASFATALLGGVLMTVWAVAVLLPGMHQASEIGKLRRAGNETDYVQLFRVWWENNQARKRDMREWKKTRKLTKHEPTAEINQPQKRVEDLSKEDFLPL
ncbi:efflux RND transporter permease subunit [Brevibacillus migulae]|uniref:efflux RND transporter permease subunit n=1 Tax=Brevibacillus migulae TaxID=1644114 RepID=UPI00106EF04F|nr:efflux RND transporter permease subunit [Brevibacillus migulae]